MDADLQAMVNAGKLDSKAAAALEKEILSAKTWHALGAWDPAERTRAFRAT